MSISFVHDYNYHYEFDLGHFVRGSLGPEIGSSSRGFASLKIAERGRAR